VVSQQQDGGKCNKNKIKCMLVTGKRLGDNIDDSSLNLRTDNDIIEQLASQKLLGIIIDQELDQEQDLVIHVVIVKIILFVHVSGVKLREGELLVLYYM
jgi:hypothetical protein